MGCILQLIIAQRTASVTGYHRKLAVVCPRASPESPRRNLLCHLPGFRLLASSVKEYSSVIWSLQICGVLLHKSQVPRQACAVLLLLMSPPIFFGWGHVCQISLLWSCHFPLLCCRTKPRSRLRSKAKRFYLLLLYQILFLKCFHVNVITNIKDLQYRAFLNLLINSIFPDAGDGTDRLPSC